MKKDNGDLSSEPLSIPDGIAMTTFQRSTGPQFSLSVVFEVELSNEEKMKVFFDEEVQIEALYTDSSSYSAIGQEFCFVFDIFYGKSGTEAVVESFYRVVEKQEIEGGQTIGVLMNRAKINWCLPSVIQCDSAITERAKLYINGDKELGLAKHHIPVYRDRRSWQKREGDMSKFFQRISSSHHKLPFLL